MSLPPKRQTTEKTRDRSKQNGRQSRGAVTPAGKARAAGANLRHGFYSEAPQEALVALGKQATYEPKSEGGSGSYPSPKQVGLKENVHEGVAR